MTQSVSSVGERNPFSVAAVWVKCGGPAVEAHITRKSFGTWIENAEHFAAVIELAPDFSPAWTGRIACWHWNYTVLRCLIWNMLSLIPKLLGTDRAGRYPGTA